MKSRIAKAWLEFLAGRLGGLTVDIVMLAASYFSAVLLRFDLRAPRWGWETMALSFLTVAAVHVIALIVCGCYRLAWRRTTLADLPRYLLATLIACVVLTTLRFFLSIESFTHIRPPYSITLISFVLSTITLVGWRIVWSWMWGARNQELSLLSRQVRRMDPSVAENFLRGKTVMVTGAGGSIGSELVRQTAAAGAAKILMVERSENALYEIDREMRASSTAVEMKPLMIDINDVDKMQAIFQNEKPDVVLHAAAYKHVPMVEMNPEEGWRNNTEATKALAKLSNANGVKRFVLISTDKAVNPVSVMGKTKLAAEKAIMEISGSGAGTSFCAVRFGNVMGSSGSVVPLFREQIANKRPITITHPDMRRYFMTVREAVGLVLQAASRQEKAIYTLDMGEPVRILDLAEGMIRNAGYKPYIDIPIVYIGIRPGEKLAEELDISAKSAYKTDMARIYVNKE
jgi:FlaA1/EpsC-like NDP-sugar epimerase